MVVLRIGPRHDNEFKVRRFLQLLTPAVTLPQLLSSAEFISGGFGARSGQVKRPTLRRTPRRRNLLRPRGGEDRDRKLAPAFQRRASTRRARRQTSRAGGLHPSH